MLSNTTSNSTYLMIMRSIGIKKLASDDFQIGLILIFLITEVQSYLFHHPYFQFYVLSHFRQDLKINAKLRAFMFVEQ
jgi:hypothetical protein